MLHELTVLAASDIPGGLPGKRPLVEEVPQDFGLRYDAAHSDQGMLFDGFGRKHTYLRISLVEQCNLRCGYCMPEEGLVWTANQDLLHQDEILRLATLFVAEGVTKVRLTGGEPLLRHDIEGIAQGISRLDGLETLALTTNGLLLPKKLKALQAAGVNVLNISLDTLQFDRFKAITRRDGLALVLQAIDEAVHQGFQPLKVNCVVLRGVNDDELCDFVEWTRDLPIEVRFIEFMPFDGNRWDDTHLVTFAQMRERLLQRFTLEPLSGTPNDTSKVYRVPGYEGTVGFISSMTEPFCEGCNRLRITADGNLKVCLFGTAEVSLRDALRAGASDEDLRHIIGAAVARKHARHAGMYHLATMQNRPMITIGG